MTVSPVWPGLIEAYRSRLPVSDATPVITLQEGATPLLPAPELSRRTGCDVYLKVEGANPTGSFKDRGMTMAISKAVEEGSQGDEQLLALARRLAEEDGGAHRRGPRALVGAEERLEGLTQLVRTVRASVEQGQLPAVERLQQVVGRLRETRLQLDDEGRPERVEARRLPGRELRRRRRHGPHAVRPPVEALEDDGARRDASRRPEPQRAHGAAELGRGVGHPARLRVEIVLELEHERTVDLAAPVAREQPARVRPRGG